MVCRKCGGVNPEGSFYCHACGADLLERKTESENIRIKQKLLYAAVPVLTVMIVSLAVVIGMMSNREISDSRTEIFSADVISATQTQVQNVGENTTESTQILSETERQYETNVYIPEDPWNIYTPEDFTYDRQSLLDRFLDEANRYTERETDRESEHYDLDGMH